MRELLCVCVCVCAPDLLSPELGPEGSWRYRYSLSLSEKRWTSCCWSKHVTSLNSADVIYLAVKIQAEVLTRIWSTLVWTVLLQERRSINQDQSLIISNEEKKMFLLTSHVSVRLTRCCSWVSAAACWALCRPPLPPDCPPPAGRLQPAGGTGPPTSGPTNRCWEPPSEDRRGNTLTDELAEKDQETELKAVTEEPGLKSQRL